jgi:hypothetical protein
MPDETARQQQGIALSRALRRAIGEADEPGSCRDCGGVTVVPDPATGHWQDCPTCRGTGGGIGVRPPRKAAAVARRFRERAVA